MDQLTERLTNPFAILLLTFCGLAYALHSRFSSRAPLPGLPWVGKDNSQLFAEARASIASFTNSRTWLHEGYHKYLKAGKSYITPDFSGTPHVIIPKDQIKWLIDKDDRGVSVSKMHAEQLEGRYSFTDPYVLENTYHEHVIHKALARHIPALIPNIQDEVQRAVDDAFGLETEWHEVCAYDAIMKIVARVSNRMFVGKPLCRNEEYLKSSEAFAMDIMHGVALLSFVPKALKPLFGPLITISNHRHYRGAAKHTLPIIKERLKLMDRKAQDSSCDWQAPNDYFTWHINLARAENETRECDPTLISRRLMALNFAAIHTTTFTMTNALFDLIGSPHAQDNLAGLEEEARRVFTSEENYSWTKPGLAKLIRADSALRESFRISGFMTRGMGRLVTDPHGITNEKHGFSLPKGAYVGTDVYSVHMDPEFYPKPEEYDAFRFSRPREEFEARERQEGEALSEEDRKESLRLKRTGFVTTSETFLPFGHGKHAWYVYSLAEHVLLIALSRRRLASDSYKCGSTDINWSYTDV